MKLSSLFVELPKSKLPAATANIQGAYPFFVSGSDIKRSDEFIFDGEAVILSTGGNAVIHFGQGCFAYSTDCWTLEPKKNEVYPLYLYQWLLQKQDQIDTLGFEGSGLRHLKKNYVRNLEIDLPELAEQTKIAEILSCIDTAIEQTEAMIAKQQRIKTGLMQDLLSKGIDEHGNIRTEHTHAFKDSPLGRIPEEWNVGGFENYVISNAGIKSGPFGSSITKDMYSESGYRVYGQEQVIGGTLEIGDYFITEQKFKEMAAYAIKSGDVLISLMGTIGHVLIVPKKYHSGVINPRLLRFRPDKKRCLADFLRLLLLSQSVQLQLEKFALGVTMQGLSAGIIKKVCVVLIEVNEQKRIIKVLDESEKHILSLFDSLNKLKRTKTALMQDLLSGKVRVNQLIQ